MSQYLEKAMKSADGAEAYMLDNTQTTVKFESGQLSSINEDEGLGIALRIIKNGKMGFSTTTRKDGAEGLAQRAMNTAPYGGAADFKFSGKAVAPKVECFDPKVRDFETGRMIELGTSLVSAIKAVGSEIEINCSVTKNVQTVTVENSEGNDAKFSQSYFGIGLEGKITKEGNFVTFEEGLSSARLDTDCKKMIDNIKEDYVFCKKNASLTSGKYEVILEPKIAEDLMRPILAMCDGKNVEKKVSPLTTKFNELAFDKRLTVVDDPSTPWMTGSVPFDDEGVPASRKPIIENGVVRNFLHNLSSATALKMKALGNGQRTRPLLGGRTYASLPSPGVNNIIISPGNTDSKKMISGVKNGLYIKMMMGTLLGNHVTGVVSGNIWLGYKIENGQIVGRVKDCMLTFNVMDVLKDNLVELSSDTIWYGSICSPFFHLKDIQVSTK